MTNTKIEQTTEPAHTWSETLSRLTTQALGARNLEDVLAAKQALRNFIRMYPEARETFRDAFEQLSNMEDIARERAAQPPEQIEWYHQHDCLMRQADSAITTVEVTDALQKIEAWLRLYPMDETLQPMREQLILTQEVLNETTTEAVSALQSVS